MRNMGAIGIDEDFAVVTEYIGKVCRKAIEEKVRYTAGRKAATDILMGESAKRGKIFL